MVINHEADWPNGKALDYESRDCRFDPCVGQIVHCTFVLRINFWFAFGGDLEVCDLKCMLFGKTWV